MLGEILEYQIKGADFVMLMCCYSKLGLDVLLMSRPRASAHIQTRHGSSYQVQTHANENTGGLSLLRV